MNRDGGYFGSQGLNAGPTNVALPNFNDFFTRQTSEWRLQEEEKEYRDVGESDSELDEPESMERLQIRPLVPLLDVCWKNLDRIMGSEPLNKQSCCAPPSPTRKIRNKRVIPAEQMTDSSLVFTWRREKDVRRNRKRKGRKAPKPVVQVFTWKRMPDSNRGGENSIQLADLHKHCILGEGQFGQVWMVSAEQKKRKPFALKVQSKYELVEEDQVEFALSEKKIMSALDHPFILGLEATFQDEFFVYMLMDLVQGGELWSRLHYSHADQKLLNLPPQVQMPEQHAKFYALAMADALLYLHQKHNVVYRDLKPENILLDADGYPKLIDFGLAKCLDETDGYTYTMVGTPSYCAPEIVMAQGHNTSADDWSLGVLIYDMVAGFHPFLEDDDMEQMQLFQAIARVEYPSLPNNVSATVTDLLARLLVAQPLHRLGGDALLQHAWFSDLDLEALRRRELPSPWVPSVTNPLDTACFEDWSDLEDKTQERYPKLEEVHELRFASF